MNKAKFNIQDQFLNQARKDQTEVVVELVGGGTIEGLIRGFDSFCVLMEGEMQALIYKHAISHIKPRGSQKVQLGTHD